MKVTEVVLSTLFYLSSLCGQSSGASTIQEMITVDLSDAMITTSPLKSDSNSTRFLLLQYKTCAITLPLSPSWLLIDLGYMVSGLSQIRLFSDYGIQNAYEFLTDIEVNVAEYLLPTDIQNSKFLDGNHFSHCGSTGTVSSDTFNAVVDCASSSRVRWVLLKKQGQLHLCYIQILQNEVKPGCFQRISQQHSLYKRAKENLSVFRSNKHLKLLKCQQNCDTDRQCGAIAFIPLSDGTGICQLLRPSDSNGDFFCDDSCFLIINRCHLGERTAVRTIDNKEVTKLSSTERLYALSIEVNGAVTCDPLSCGKSFLFVTDDSGKVHSCGFVDSSEYRVLQNVVFMCDIPVKGPKDLIIKENTKNKEINHKFTSVNIRFSEEGSFAFDVLSIFQSSTLSATSLTTLITTTPTLHKIKASSSSTSSNKLSPSVSQTFTRSTEKKTVAYTRSLEDNWTLEDSQGRISNDQTLELSLTKTISVMTLTDVNRISLPMKIISQSVTKRTDHTSTTTMKTEPSTTKMSVSKQTDYQISSPPQSETKDSTVQLEYNTTQRSVSTQTKHRISSTPLTEIEPSTEPLKSNISQWLISTTTADQRSSAPLTELETSTVLYRNKISRWSISLQTKVLTSSPPPTKIELSSIPFGNKIPRWSTFLQIKVQRSSPQPSDKELTTVTLANDTKPFGTNTIFVVKNVNSERKKFPFLWIILLICGFLFVSVIVVAVIVTFFDGRRKTKKWEIPNGGFCPQDDTDSEKCKTFSKFTQLENCNSRPKP